MKSIDQLINEAPDELERTYEAIEPVAPQQQANDGRTRIERLIDFPRLHQMQEQLWGDEWKAKYQIALQVATQGGIVAIIGNRGTGKTQMAHHVAQNVRLPDLIKLGKKDGFSTRTDRPAIYRTAMDIFLELRSSYSPKADRTEWELFKVYEAAALLVIDEISVSSGSAFEDMKITAIMDKRYQAIRPTILIGNVTAKELSERLGKSVISRITENGAVIECNWKSFRTA